MSGTAATTSRETALTGGIDQDVAVVAVLYIQNQAAAAVCGHARYESRARSGGVSETSGVHLGKKLWAGGVANGADNVVDAAIAAGSHLAQRLQTMYFLERVYRISVGHDLDEAWDALGEYAA